MVKATKANAERNIFGDDEEDDVAGVGHNTKNATGEQLKAIIERYESADEDVKAATIDRSEILKEAKGNGFCTKTIKKIVKMRAASREAVREEQEMLETYLHAIGWEI